MSAASENKIRKAFVNVLDTSTRGVPLFVQSLQGHSIYYLYSKGVQEYLFGELEYLLKTIDNLRLYQPAVHEAQEHACALALLIFRSQLRQQDLSPESLLSLRNQLHKNLWPIWQGEIHVVLGMAEEHLGQYGSAHDDYLLAAQNFEKVGALRKAVKAELNAISADSHIQHNRKRHIANYLHISRKARKVNELGMAGLALNNVAAEYHKMGAFQLALKISNRAMVFISADFGARHYHMARLQRAEILFDLNRVTEALMELEESLLANFAEVIEARKILCKKMSVEKSTVDIDTQKLTPSWREKHQAQHMRPPLKLGRLEQKLLELLTTGPATRDELIAQMYDLTSNPFALENRFHVLMNRVKRKVPGAVIFDGTYYRLIDDSPLTSLLRA